MDKLFHPEKLYVKEPIYFQSILILIIMFYKKKSIITIVSLNALINGDVNIICYDLKYVVPLCLGYISHNYYNTLSPLHIPMKEHDIIMDENN